MKKRPKRGPDIIGLRDYLHPRPEGGKHGAQGIKNTNELKRAFIE